MLKNVTLKNFQSHKDSTFNFHPGVNVITGVSDSGKTALFRAIKKLWKNRPLGTRFVSNFAQGSPTVISTEWDDNKTVLLEISNETNYTVVQDGKNTTFKSFGSDVPDMVSTILNLDAINMAGQLDKYYLITSTPGEVAREFNKITRIERVDAWVSSLATKINTENGDIKLLNKQIEEEEKKLYLYSDLDKFEEDVVHGEYLQLKMAECNKKVTALALIIKQLKQVEVELKEYQEIINILDDDVKELENVYTMYSKKVVQQKLLEKLVSDWLLLEEKTKFLTVEPLVTKLNLYISDYKVLQTDQTDISELVTQIKKKEQLLLEWNRNQVQNINELSACLKLIGKCPTCLSIIDQSKIEAIIKEL